MDGETYTQREDPFFAYLLPGTRGCQRQRRPGRLRVPRSTTVHCTLSKPDRVVLITWSPSGYTPARPECPNAPSFSCLLIKMWQLTKAYRVSRNEPKIYFICYITLRQRRLASSSGVKCPSTRPDQHMCSLLATLWKMSLFSLSGTAEARMAFFLVPVSLFFRNAQISLPIRGFWELLHFWIYSISFFIFIFY